MLGSCCHPTVAYRDGSDPSSALLHCLLPTHHELTPSRPVQCIPAHSQSLSVMGGPLRRNLVTPRGLDLLLDVESADAKSQPYL